MFFTYIDICHILDYHSNSKQTQIQNLLNNKSDIINSKIKIIKNRNF